MTLLVPSRTFETLFRCNHPSGWFAIGHSLMFLTFVISELAFFSKIFVCHLFLQVVIFFWCWPYFISIAISQSEKPYPLPLHKVLLKLNFLKETFIIIFHLMSLYGICLLLIWNWFCIIFIWPCSSVQLFSWVYSVSKINRKSLMDRIHICHLLMTSPSPSASYAEWMFYNLGSGPLAKSLIMTGHIFEQGALP